MKKIILTLTLAIMASGCNDSVNSVFSDYFVCIKDEYNSEKSVVEDTFNNFTVSYYVNLIAPTLDSDVTVYYDIVVGDGLKEGVDFTLAKKGTSITIPRGINRMPIRITYKKHDIDPGKDNTITIRLTGIDKEGISIGYPGPKAKYSSHTITKILPL